MKIDKCIKEGGRVTTRAIGKTKYVRVCTIKGKEVLGRVKKRKQ